ncbi:MAG: cell wall-binding repeat-containing protein [Clostridium tyrobutyricum]|jgi:putative cell wall-binding protein|uniref:cell wall-binding repeat-containing protein n=1 Tax=Clostridium tyrobutyricum TaxID=1519 RepID=UPI00057FE011|nr:cell wall-binding repeat-containing protein [Clostridium tyrobutyricum]MBV4447146.1 cell wall-binding repeat-containing protein [Clostridium tyrobutyricum]MCH4199978.1 cell wall-binding repeat-containing protein [Clostridium tyrobutyricum]MCH4237575.1 cell wall-binding repeat-containing protein [Clostridium tyrobutyricum]MCH4259969.1 cell wall-binding repeat-containing protein [Clostridium tyrobutyricum]MCI1240306.1 cell wall-binding repeat-containing protein [Clostridium tyrobutyricum]
MNKKKIISSFILSIALISSTIAASPVATFAASSRLGGADRYETSVKISQNGWANGSDYVILASGEGYADALCAAPIAKKYNAPILLTTSKTLNSTTKSEITRLKAKNVIEIGGPASISSNIENQLENEMSLKVTRLGGTDRYETSANVARELGDVSDMVLTSGIGYADALSIAPIAASEGYPILLTPKNSVTNSVKSYINSHRSDSTKVYVVGGSGVIPESTLSSVPNPMRIFGQNRYETNVSVMEFFKSDLKLSNVYIAKGDGPNGNEFADALSASALAAETSSPVVLTNNTLNSSIQEFIKSSLTKDTNVVSIGGQASVPDSLVTDIQNVINGTDETQNPSTGGGSGSSQSDYDTIESVSSKLKKIDTAGLDDAQKKVIEESVNCMDKYVNDKDYDYTDDVDNIKNLYNNLSGSEKTGLQNEVIKSGVSVSEALVLQNKFEL